MGDRDRYIHLKEISVHFIKRRPTSVLELVLEADAGANKQESKKFKKYNLVDSVHWNVIHWNLDTYVRFHTMVTLTVRQVHLKTSVAELSVPFKPGNFSDDRVVSLKDSRHRTIDFVCGRSQSLADVTRFLNSQTRTVLASKVPRFLKHPRLAALPPPTSDMPYATIHCLNDDILLGIFNCYRLDYGDHWNLRRGWCRLSHVCQRWRHLVYECAFHLDVHIECTNGSAIVGMLDDLPQLPLFVDYVHTREGVALTEQDELGIYHALRLRGRVRHINLDLLPSIFQKVFVLVDDHFPMLEHLSLSFTAKNDIPLTLPKAFLAPNLRHLALCGIGLPKRLRFLTSTVSLVTLKLSDIQISTCYFRPRILLARLSSLLHLKELSIEFSFTMPYPSVERELLGEQRAPITLPSLKYFWFNGVGAYLEPLVAQIRAPLLEQLDITLFNEIPFALPHLFHFINTTEEFKLPVAIVHFDHNGVYVATATSTSQRCHGPLHWYLGVMCKQLDWQINYAAQICNALIPTLSSVEQFALTSSRNFQIPAESHDGAIYGRTWHEILRPFIGVKQLLVMNGLLEELSRALQVDEVGSDLGFLPNLRSIHGDRNLFTSFTDTCQTAGRPVEFVRW